MIDYSGTDLTPTAARAAETGATKLGARLVQHRRIIRKREHKKMPKDVKEIGGRGVSGRLENFMGREKVDKRKEIQEKTLR